MSSTLALVAFILPPVLLVAWLRVRAVQREGRALAARLAAGDARRLVALFDEASPSPAFREALSATVRAAVPPAPPVLQTRAAAWCDHPSVPLGDEERAAFDAAAAAYDFLPPAVRAPRIGDQA